MLIFYTTENSKDVITKLKNNAEDVDALKGIHINSIF